jgi:hypothetical protein
LSFCDGPAIQLLIFCFRLQAIATSPSATATVSPSISSSLISTTFIWLFSPIFTSLFEDFSLLSPLFCRS